MIEKKIQDIVPQIPGESDASYCRLIIMLTQGLRTLKELHDYLEKENHKYYVSYGTLQVNSAKDNWTKRIKKYDTIREQELIEETEDIFQQLNTVSIHEMRELLENLHELRLDIMKRFRNKNEKFNSSSALKALNDYTTCYNRATEIYYINSRHPLIPDTNTTNTHTTDEKLEQVSKVLYGEDDDK
jgi:hypothetical protein